MTGAKKPKLTILPLAVPDQKPDYLLGQQDAVSAHLNQNGTLFITQHSWPDDDAVIIIAADLVDLFVERLTDLLGDGSAGRRS